MGDATTASNFGAFRAAADVAGAANAFSCWGAAAACGAATSDHREVTATSPQPAIRALFTWYHEPRSQFANSSYNGGAQACAHTRFVWAHAFHKSRVAWRQQLGESISPELGSLFSWGGSI